jgi:hypothetical protein
MNFLAMLCPKTVYVTAMVIAATLEVACSVSRSPHPVTGTSPAFALSRLCSPT